MKVSAFPVLWCGALILLALFVSLEWREASGFRTGKHLAPDLTGLEELAQPLFSQAELVQRAEAFLHAQGRKTDGLFHSVWPRLDSDAFDTLRTEKPGLLKSLAGQGVPLVIWTVTFYEPKARLEHQEQIAIMFDQQGRLCGFKGYRFEPEQLRSRPDAAWIESQKKQVAEWLQIDVDKLKPLSLVSAIGSGQGRSDAIWEVTGQDFGPVKVLVTLVRRGEFVNFGKEVATPKRKEALAKGVQGFEFWVSIFLVVLLAFWMGVHSNSQPASGLGWLRISLVAALVLAGIVCVAQAGFLGTTHGWLCALFVLGAVVFGLFAFACAKAGTRADAVPSCSCLRWGLVGAVPLAYLIMSFGCSANPFTGCSSVCTLVRYTCVPLGALALTLGRNNIGFYAFALAMALLSLMPHCVCDNFINHPWMERMGVSPMCYFYGYAVTVVSVAGLNGVIPRLCLLISAGSAALVAAFAAGHQLFGFPW